MNINGNIWRKYFEQKQMDIALKNQEPSPVEYGEVIYESPEIENKRWLVTVFKGEYNVFVDIFDSCGRFTRCLGASFNWKDRAMEFALKMFLVCSGSLRRKDRYK